MDQKPSFASEGSNSDHGARHSVDSICRVLVVEDDDASRDALGEFLKLQGYDVCTASDGAAAFDLAKSFRPDVVCTDICMPGVSGVELCQSLQHEPLTQDTTIVAVTALARDAWEDFGDVGFSAIFAKPLEFEALKARLEQLTCGPPHSHP